MKKVLLATSALALSTGFHQRSIMVRVAGRRRSDSWYWIGSLASIDLNVAASTATDNGMTVSFWNFGGGKSTDYDDDYPIKPNVRFRYAYFDYRSWWVNHNVRKSGNWWFIWWYSNGDIGLSSTVGGLSMVVLIPMQPLTARYVLLFRRVNGWHRSVTYWYRCWRWW